MAWRLNGQLVETCSCNVMCPCWFGIKDLQIMDQGWCDSALLFRIGEGDSDGVDLGGRMVVMAMDFPGPTMLDGNATARILIDDAATPEQMRELEGIFSGAKGGSHSSERRNRAGNLMGLIVSYFRSMYGILAVSLLLA